MEPDAEPGAFEARIDQGGEKNAEDQQQRDKEQGILQGILRRVQEPLVREHFDVVVSRAVANLSVLSEYCLPFVKVGGAFISYKSDQSEEELAKGSRAISILGGHVKHVSHFTLDDSDLGRALIYIEKEKTTAKKYPRKAGTPSKEPLS